MWKKLLVFIVRTLGTAAIEKAVESAKKQAGDA
jgi:hypothetical protein